MTDTFRSPNDHRHVYTTRVTDSFPDASELRGVHDVTRVSSEGVDSYSAEEVLVDGKRLKQRLGLGQQSLREAIESANFRWSLADNDADLEIEEPDA